MAAGFMRGKYKARDRHGAPVSSSVSGTQRRPRQRSPARSAGLVSGLRHEAQASSAVSGTERRSSASRARSAGLAIGLRHEAPASPAVSGTERRSRQRSPAWRAGRIIGLEPVGGARRAQREEHDHQRRERHHPDLAAHDRRDQLRAARTRAARRPRRRPRARAGRGSSAPRRRAAARRRRRPRAAAARTGRRGVRSSGCRRPRASPTAIASASAAPWPTRSSTQKRAPAGSRMALRRDTRSSRRVRRRHAR